MNNSLLKAFEIVWLLARHQGELGLKDICMGLNMNKTTVFRYIETLISLNLLEKHKGRYFLGIGLFELGSSVRIQTLIVERIHPILEKLAQEINEAVNLAQIYENTALYLDRAESKRRLQLKASVGDKLPLYSTGLGKSILSVLEMTRLNTLVYNLKMERMTGSTITDPAQLMKQIDLVRTRGYSVDREEFDEGLICVAVPLKITELNFIGGISISGPSNRLSEERIGFMTQKLLETRNEILDTLSHVLGGSND